MDVEQLLTLRQDVDKLIASKAPVIEQKIKTLQATLKAIKPRAYGTRSEAPR
jgi:hypothetical protein